MNTAIFTFCWSLISSVKSSFSDICRRIISQVVCNADFCKQLSNHPQAIILKTLFCYSIKYIQQTHKLLPWSFMIIRQQSCLIYSSQSTCSRHLAVVCFTFVQSGNNREIIWEYIVLPVSKLTFMYTKNYMLRFIGRKYL